MKTKLCLFLKCYFFKKKTQYFFLSFYFIQKICNTIIIYSLILIYKNAISDSNRFKTKIFA